MAPLNEFTYNRFSKEYKEKDVATLEEFLRIYKHRYYKQLGKCYNRSVVEMKKNIAYLYKPGSQYDGILYLNYTIEKGNPTVAKGIPYTIHQLVSAPAPEKIFNWNNLKDKVILSKKEWSPIEAYNQLMYFDDQLGIKTPKDEFLFIISPSSYSYYDKPFTTVLDLLYRDENGHQLD